MGSTEWEYLGSFLYEKLGSPEELSTLAVNGELDSLIGRYFTISNLDNMYDEGIGLQFNNTYYALENGVFGIYDLYQSLYIDNVPISVIGHNNPEITDLEIAQYEESGLVGFTIYLLIPYFNPINCGYMTCVYNDNGTMYATPYWGNMYLYNVLGEIYSEWFGGVAGGNGIDDNNGYLAYAGTSRDLYAPTSFSSNRAVDRYGILYDMTNNAEGLTSDTWYCESNHIDIGYESMLGLPSIYNISEKDLYNGTYIDLSLARYDSAKNSYKTFFDNYYRYIYSSYGDVDFICADQFYAAEISIDNTELGTPIAELSYIVYNPLSKSFKSIWPGINENNIPPFGAEIYTLDHTSRMDVCLPLIYELSF